MAPKKSSKKKPDKPEQQQEAAANIATTDYAQIQEEEFVAIQSIYSDGFEEIKSKSAWGGASQKAFQLTLKPFDDPKIEARVAVEFTATYPKTAPLLTLKAHSGLRDKSVQAIKDVLVQVPKSLLGNTMIYDIATAISDVLADEADHRAKGEALPALDEERAKNEVIASKMAEERELKRIQTKEREKAEEDQAMQLLVNQELQRRNEEARKKRRGSSDYLPVPESFDPEAITFERLITVSANSVKYAFQSVAGLTKFAHGPVTEVYTAYPRVSASDKETGAAPLLVAVKKCTIPKSKVNEKKKLLNLEKDLESLKQISSHVNTIQLLDFRIDSQGKDWDLSILLEYANGSSLSDAISTYGTIPLPQVRNWTTGLLEALHHYHTNSLAHGRIRPSNILLVKGNGGMTVKLADASFQAALYDINGKPKISSAWSVNWKAPELIDRESSMKLVVKSDIWDLGVVFLQMLFQLDVPERYKSPNDVISLGLSKALTELINDFFRQNAKDRPTAFQLTPSEFLRNQHSIYDTSSGNNGIEFEASSASLTGRRRRRSSSHPAAIGLQPSRYRTEWEEVCRLGKGGYGEVVKARHKMDLGTYAIKKIRQKDSLLSKVIPEIMMLSRLNHPNVVRYFTAWMETDSGEDKISSESDQDGSSELQPSSPKFQSSVRPMLSQGLDFVSSTGAGGFVFGYDTDDEGEDGTNSSNVVYSDEGDSDEDTTEDGAGNHEVRPRKTRFLPDPEESHRYVILYIQMEFCERQTLRDLIIQGLDKNVDEVWRLFRKIVTGLKHVHDAGIIHRDLKPENIFIDTANSPKIGDFGLATSGVHAAVLKANSNALDADMTKDIGTASYVAPEVLGDSSGSYSEKVDMYSLGIILFEMCYSTSTSMERAVVVANIRKKDCILPEKLLTPETAKQREIIRALLSHRPTDRPSAKDLLRGGRIPVKIEDDQVQEILEDLAKPDSVYEPTMMEVLFGRNRNNQVKATAWDTSTEHVQKPNANGDHSSAEEPGYETLLFSHLKVKLGEVFRHHGAVETDRPAIFPRSELYDNKNIVQLLDSSGTQLQLPYDLTLPLARDVAREAPACQRLYSFDRVYRDSATSGKPRTVTEVDFDIVSKDALDVALKEAEAIEVLDELMDALPSFASTQTYFHVNHWDLLDLILEACRIDSTHRAATREIISKLNIRTATWTQVRTELRNADTGIAATSLDELSRFDFRDTYEKAFHRLKKLLPDPRHRERLQVIAKSLGAVLNYTAAFGIKRKIYICPLSCFHAQFYESGIMFQLLVDRKQHKDVLAAGGRYDRLIQLQKPKGNQAMFNSCHAVGFSLGLDNLVRLLVQLQMKSNSGFLKKAANQGKIPPKHIPVRRCDILVASFDSRLLRSAGLQLLSHLWRNGLTAEMATDANDLEELVQRNPNHSWVVLVKSDSILSKTEVSVVSLDTRHSVETRVENLITHLHHELQQRDRYDEDSPNLPNTTPTKPSSSTRPLPHRPLLPNTQQIPTAPSSHSVQFLVGQHKGKKTNRAAAAEFATSRIASTLAAWSSAPVAAVEASDDALEGVRGARLSEPESWRRVIQKAPAGDRGYLSQLQSMLEGFRDEWRGEGEKEERRVAFVVNFRTGWCCLVDLGL